MLGGKKKNTKTGEEVPYAILLATVVPTTFETNNAMTHVFTIRALEVKGNEKIGEPEGEPWPKEACTETNTPLIDALLFGVWCPRLMFEQISTLVLVLKDTSNMDVC